jgi:hypothetical protein
MRWNNTFSTKLPARKRPLGSRLLRGCSAAFEGLPGKLASEKLKSTGEVGK